MKATLSTVLVSRWQLLTFCSSSEDAYRLYSFLDWDVPRDSRSMLLSKGFAGQWLGGVSAIIANAGQDAGLEVLQQHDRQLVPHNIIAQTLAGCAIKKAASAPAAPVTPAASAAALAFLDLLLGSMLVRRDTQL